MNTLRKRARSLTTLFHRAEALVAGLALASLTTLTVLGAQSATPTSATAPVTAGPAEQAGQAPLPQRRTRQPVPTLVRCLATQDMACFEITLSRPIGATALAVDTSRSAWTATALGTELIGPGIIRVGFDTTQRIRLVVAMDISGSMKGEGIAFLRSALRSFLAALPATGVDIALVPFESQRVAGLFADATFQAPKGAIGALEAAPLPSLGNTALYSAIAEGLRTLDRPGGTPGATVLLVLTDGVNDVGHPRDDPGLLAGAAGSAAAAQLIATSPHQVWLVGVGNGVNRGELTSLAGTRGNASVIAMDPGALLGLLEQIRMALATQYTLVYGIPATTAARLARRPLTVAVHGDSARLGAWRPPLLARPAFAGAADTALLARDVRMLAIGAGSGGSDRVIVGTALLAVLLSIYAMLWRLAGEPRNAVPAGAPAEPKSHAAKKGAPDTLLRRDALDAPPRSAQDITNEDAA